jgi:SAM-dependent methyltransferase
MASRTSISRPDVEIAVISVTGVIATFLTAFLFEALTDRDWSVSEWEWPQVLTLALLSAFGALWLLGHAVTVTRRRRQDSHRAGEVARVFVDARGSSATRVPQIEDQLQGRSRRLTPRRVAGAGYRRLPRAPFRRVMPTVLWRGAFRFWLSVLAAQPDTRRGVRDLLISYDDAYRAVDQAAIRYDDGIHVKHRLTHYHDFFVERVNPGERVLDIGSGKGELAFDLATLADATVVGVDHDPSHLAFARERFAHPGLEFVEADVLEWIPEGHFDVVVLSNVLEHLDGRIAFLRGLVGSASPSRLLFRVPVYERDWTVPLRHEVGLLAYWDRDHTIEYVPETFIAELAGAGLHVVELEQRWGEIWALAQPAPI